MDFVLRLWKYVRIYKLLFVLLAVWMILWRTTAMTVPLFTKAIVDRVIIQGDIRMLHLLSFGLMGLFFVTAMVSSLAIVTSHKLQHLIIFRLRNLLYNQIQKLSIAYFETEKRGPIISKVMNDVADCNAIITDGFVKISVAIVTIIGVTTALFSLDWKMAIICMLPMPFIGFLIFNFNTKAKTGYRRQKRKRADVLSILQENVYGIKEIKTFTQEDQEMDRFSQKGRNFLRIQMYIGKLLALYHPLILLFSSFGTLLILWYGGYRVIQGDMTLGTLVAFVGYVGLLYQPIHEFNHVNNVFQSARAASERIFEIMDMAPEVTDKKDAIEYDHPVKGAVDFKDIYFSYKKGEDIIKGISFKAEEGDSVAIVGPSGSGKTTLISLISRFYDINQGEISIDGKNIQDYKLTYLRHQIGIVPQEPFLFNATVAENISFGKLDATREDIIEVAKTARADDFIKDFPDGYDTEVGEQGSQLSGGQRQRIAIARALLKNPPILILDEATSAIDSETEKLIQEALDRLMEGRTSFIIAHRLSTIRKAKKIIVMKNGKIVETGTHKELLEQEGLYFYLYQIQFGLEDIKEEIPLLMKKQNRNYGKNV